MHTSALLKEWLYHMSKEFTHSVYAHAYAHTHTHSHTYMLTSAHILIHMHTHAHTDDTTGQQLISKFIHHPQIIFSDGQALIPNTPGGACIVTLLEKYCVQRDIIFMLRVRL